MVKNLKKKMILMAQKGRLNAVNATQNPSALCKPLFLKNQENPLKFPKSIFFYKIGIFGGYFLAFSASRRSFRHQNPNQDFFANLSP